MMTYIKPAILLLLLLTILTGIIYPLSMTGIGLLLFPTQARGSLVVINAKTVGSSLIGQNFTSAKYFHSRPSVAGKGYDPMAFLISGEVSTSVELIPTSTQFQATIKKMTTQLQQEFNQNGSAVPIDLVTRSGSGLDPDITPAAAIFQIKRIAHVRNLSEAKLLALIEEYTTMRQFGILGEPRVNVLALNRGLDKLQ
ncbi:potassium-transporting ATPase subunit KdpC [soil metagenome]